MKEVINNLNRSISIKKLNQQTITFQNKEHQAHRVSLVNSTKHLRKELYQFSIISFEE